MEQEKKIITYSEYSEALRERLREQAPFLRKKTYQTYGSVVHLYLLWKEFHFQKPLRYYVHYMLSRGLSKRTAHNHISVLRSILKPIYEERGLADEFSDYKKLQYSSRSPMYFTSVQIKHLKERILCDKPYFFLACELLYGCFIRPNELRHLKVQDVHLQGSKILIRGSFSKNGKDQYVTIPQSIRRSCLRLEDALPRDYIFSGKDFKPGREQLGRDRMSKYFKKQLLASGIQGHYSFYSLKHTGVVRAVKAGVNIKEIQVQLRHHSLDMVNEYLKNLGVFDLEEIELKLPEL